MGGIYQLQRWLRELSPALDSAGCGVLDFGGPVTDVERMLTDIGFYSQVIGDSERTIICPPSLVDPIRELVEAHELGGVYMVRASPVCPDTRLFILDEQAMEASFQRATQQCLRSLYR